MVDRKRGLNGLFGHIRVVAVAGCEKGYSLKYRDRWRCIRVLQEKTCWIFLKSQAGGVYGRLQKRSFGKRETERENAVLQGAAGENRLDVS